MNPSSELVEKARAWLCAGGGGHEDGEDGIRAGTISMTGAIELMAEFAESAVRDAVSENHDCLREMIRGR